MNYIFKEKGHLRTETNMVDKFNNISLKLRIDSAFIGREFLDGAALKKKWDRISSCVDLKYAISTEGANLSCLEEEPSPLEKLVLDLLKERYETSKAKDEQKAKDKIRNEKMLTHEKSMLQRQDKNVDVISLADADGDADGDADVDGDVSDCSDGGSDKSRVFKKPKLSREKTTPPQLFDFEVEIITALKDDPRLVEIEVAERKQKLDNSLADKIHSRDMEIRRIEADERMSLERSRAELERSKADQALATAQLKMLEMFTSHLRSKE